jgi:hypothetical protein
MRQATFCVPLEVKPESCSRLSALVEEMRRQEDTGQPNLPENFARIKRDIPALHFLSMSVFTAVDYDPLFILEANFDGPPSILWGQIEAAFGPRLREILRCCKKPLTRDSALYEAVTAPGSQVPVAPYLEARVQRPSVFHHGNRGLTRNQILDEAGLFAAARGELDAVIEDGPSPYRGINANAIHALLRKKMLSAYPWLADRPRRRISLTEHALDILKLLAFAIGVLLMLSLPGIALAAALPWREYLLVVLFFAVFAGALIYRKREPLPGTDVPTEFSLGTFFLRSTPLIAGYVLVATALLVLLAVVPSWILSTVGLRNDVDFREAFRLVAGIVLLGLVSLSAIVPLIVLWLRYLELRDSSHDSPQVNERLFREMVRREDWVAQNHMGSIVMIKPGILRTAIIRAGHLGLGLVLRIVATDGYLGSMRTIHFAHWAFLNNGSRLLFFSNFDHSWDSYLDDFIEKAHGGLTLAWGCGVGFPPTRFLVYDGASHGRKFKNWALASRAVSRFWYSAYPTLTVDQIERNNRIAAGLRRPRMTEEEATKWAQDL